MSGISLTRTLLPLTTAFIVDSNHKYVECNKKEIQTIYQSDKTSYFKKEDAQKIFNKYQNIYINSLNTTTKECKEYVEKLKKSNFKLGQFSPDCEPTKEIGGLVKVIIPYRHELYCKTPKEIEHIINTDS